MERAERFVFLGVGLAFDILVPVLWIMLVLTAFTAVHRFVRVYRQAARPPRVHTPRERRPRPATTTARRASPMARRAAAHVVDAGAAGVEGDRTRRRHPSVRRNVASLSRARRARTG